MGPPMSSVLQTSTLQPPVLQSPSLNLSGDSNICVNYAKNEQNFITQLFAEQLPAVRTGFFNVRMSQGVVISPHWHTNASELIFVIDGEVQTSVFNPFARQLMTYRLRPGQVSQFPMGWFHWLAALTDRVHLLTIFDVPTPDIVYAGDFLLHLPPEVAARAFCVNPDAYAQTVAPIQQPVILGPPPGCYPAPGQAQGVAARQPMPQAGYPGGCGRCPAEQISRRGDGCLSPRHGMAAVIATTLGACGDRRGLLFAMFERNSATTKAVFAYASRFHICVSIADKRLVCVMRLLQGRPAFRAS